MKQSIIDRAERAKQRQKEHDKLTPEQKLQKLDKNLGKGIGAKRERTRLLNEIEKKKQQQKSKKSTKEAQKDVKGKKSKAKK